MFFYICLSYFYIQLLKDINLTYSTTLLTSFLTLIRPIFCIGAIVKPNWYKVWEKIFQKKNLSEFFFSDLFIRQENIYKLHLRKKTHIRKDREFQIPRINTVWKGYNSICILFQSSRICFPQDLNVKAHWKIFFIGGVCKWIP